MTKHTYMASKNQLTKMAVDKSCNRFQISLIRYLGLPHQQLPYFISLFNVLLKLAIVIHQHFHLLSSIVHLVPRWPGSGQRWKFVQDKDLVGMQDNVASKNQYNFGQDVRI
jgi:hypothetical protein